MLTTIILTENWWFRCSFWRCGWLLRCDIVAVGCWWMASRRCFRTVSLFEGRLYDRCWIDCTQYFFLLCSFVVHVSDALDVRGSTCVRGDIVTLVNGVSTPRNIVCFGDGGMFRWRRHYFIDREVTKRSIWRKFVTSRRRSVRSFNIPGFLDGDCTAGLNVWMSYKSYLLKIVRWAGWNNCYQLVLSSN